MKRLLSLLVLFELVTGWTFAQVSVQKLLTENRTDPIGIDVPMPRLSWQLTSSRQNVRQTAYEIRVGVDAASLAKGTIWQSGRVSSDQSVHVPYAGPSLQPGQRYIWQVRVWDNTTTKSSAWSSPAHWQTGLLTAANWKASWIQPGFVEDTIN
ncbi:MAG: alpha-L-rhamnosidase, partial [Cytophagaceae bacterium]